MKKKAIFAAVAGLLFLTVTVVFGEILARLIPERVPPPDPTWVQHDGFYTFHPNTRVSMENESGAMISFVTDAYGLRNERPFSEDGIRLLVLGDSFIEAGNTSTAGSFCAQLGQRLEKERVNCINGGIDGYSNHQSYRLLAHLFDALKPEVVVLMVYLGNDLRDNHWTVPDPSAPGRAPGVWRRLAGRSRLWRRLTAWRAPEAPPFQDYCRSEMMTYSNDPDAIVLQAVRKTEVTLEMFSDFCIRHSLGFYVFGIPSKAQAHEEFRQLGHFEISSENKAVALALKKNPSGYSFDRPSLYYEKICREKNIFYESLLPLFRQHREERLYGDIDVHWTPAGQRLAAAHVADVLKKKGAFQHVH